MIGEVFTRLIVKEEVESKKPGRWWLCECTCGGTKICQTSKLRQGKNKSCGCLMKEHLKSGVIKHGLHGTPEYVVWNNMKQRCLNPNSPTYPHYGGRGITICDKWRESFDNFLNDMGFRPSKNHSIGRMNNDGPYSPDNCRWESLDEQSKNKRWTQYVDYEGKSVKLIDLCKEKGIKRGLVYGRLKKGWSIEDALNEPPKEHKNVVIYGVSKPLYEHLKFYNTKYSTYKYRVEKGWTPEKAITLPNQQGVKIK